MKSSSLLTLIIFCAFMCMPSLVFAVPGQGREYDAPLDAGLSLLIAAGIGYGVKKARDKRKKDKATDNIDRII